MKSQNYYTLSESENFIQNKFGYCFYAFIQNKDCNETSAIIFNLYVHPKYRRQGKAKRLLQYVINEIKEAGYGNEIVIEASQRENSISSKNLVSFYKNMGLRIVTGVKNAKI